MKTDHTYTLFTTTWVSAIAYIVISSLFMAQGAEEKPLTTKQIMKGVDKYNKATRNGTKLLVKIEREKYENQLIGKKYKGSVKLDQVLLRKNGDIVSLIGRYRKKTKKGYGLMLTIVLETIINEKNSRYKRGDKIAVAGKITRIHEVGLSGTTMVIRDIEEGK